jgi:hypothetical protein
MADWNNESLFTLAEVLRAVEQTDELVKMHIEESRRDTEMLIAEIREHGAYVRHRIDQQESRITRLENNQPNA